MTIAKLEGLPEFDLGRKSIPWKTHRAEGRRCVTMSRENPMPCGGQPKTGPKQPT
jgi:hypothetical protein